MNQRTRSLLPGLFLLSSTSILALAGACSPTTVPQPTTATAAPVLTVVPVAPTATASASVAESEPPPPKCTDVGPALVPGLLDPTPDWKKSASDTSKPVQTACEKVKKALAKAVKAGPGKDDTELNHVGVCLPSPRGAWVFEPGEAERYKADPKDGTRGGWKVHYTLAYVQPDGKIARSDKVNGDVIAMEDHEHHGVEARALFDYDGDGVSEIVYSQFDDYGEESSFKVAIATFRDGTIKPYSPADGLDVKDVIDVDRDGRPDLMLPGPFLGTGPCGLNDQEFRAPLHVAHSVPGGSFKQDDEVAKAAVRVGCGPLEIDLVDVHHNKADTSVDPAETTRRIACARIYGLTEEATKGRVRARYPFPDGPTAELPLDSQAPGYCYPLRAMLEVAAQTPVFTTAPLCKAP